MANHGTQFDAELTLTNAGHAALPEKGWRIYFNSARLLTLQAGQGLALRHVNGDFFELSPTAEFRPLAAGDQRTVAVTGVHWEIKKSDAPAGFYLVRLTDDGAMRGQPTMLRATVSPFLSVQQTSRGPGDQLPTPSAASRYADNSLVTRVALSTRDLVVPTPVRAAPKPGKAHLDSASVIAYEPGLEAAATMLAKNFAEDVGIHVQVVAGSKDGRNVIRLRHAQVDGAKESAAGDESYTLLVAQEGIDVVAPRAAGVFYGTQTLRALLPIEAYQSRSGAVSLDCLEVEDGPRFKYRGLHLDVARNFHSVATVKKLLDLMAFYKLNRLHWHLTDDEGWRLEIKAFPELTAIGGRRGHTLDERECLLPSLGSGPIAEAGKSSGCGHYSQNEFIDVLRYAHDRHIEVIPELDFPGHARAAIKSLAARSARMRAAGDLGGADACTIIDPQDQSTYQSVQLWRDNVVDVGLESTYDVLGTVLDELVAMYRAAGAPLTVVHLGGDEVPEGAWQKSAACERLLSAGAVPDLSKKTLHAYFVKRALQLLEERGLRAGGWEECLLAEDISGQKPLKSVSDELVHDGFMAYAWNNVWGWGQEDVAYQLANVGYDVVLCNATNLYFDLAYDKDPSELGYYWAAFVDERKAFEFAPLDFYKNARVDGMGKPIEAETYATHERLTELGAQRILGLQGQLWSETLSTSQKLERAAFPKLIALAERAWAAAPKSEALSNEAARVTEVASDWRLFANKLGQRELPRLDHLAGGVGYRIPPPGALIADGLLRANTAYPGFDIRFTLDGSTPTSNSTRYERPLPVRGEVRLKTFSAAGRASETSTISP